MSNIEEDYVEVGVGPDRLQPGLEGGTDRLTPGTDAYFDGVLSPMSEPELPTDKLLKMKVSQEDLRKHCSKETLNTALNMSAHGDIFFVEDSFVKKEKVLNWKIRSENYVNPNIPMYSNSKSVHYPVVVRYKEVIAVIYFYF